jgi:hypothetical protein
MIYFSMGIICRRISWLVFLLVFPLALAQMGCSGPGAKVPILILSRQHNFGTYIGEILKAEGFSEFMIDSLNSGRITRSYLQQFDLVVLADQKSDRRTTDIICHYAGKGGNIIAIDPVDELSDLFGLGGDNGKGDGVFFAIDTASETGNSLTGKPIQLHVPYQEYSPGNGKAVAWFCNKLSGRNNFPAVVKHNYGAGRTAAFLYNLPENIVLTRQGNPIFAGEEKDGIPGLRAMDLFTDGWVESSNNTLNQADQQMSLLSHLIEEMASCKKPLPRIWYFPDTLKCLVTLTNDGEFRGENDFEPQFRDMDSMGAVMSLYVMERDKVSRQWAQKWTARGFEISGHPDDTREALSPTWDKMDSVLTSTIDDISTLYGLKMSTVVNHWFVWCGKLQDGNPEFAAQAALEVSHGLFLDVNYAHYDNNSSQGHFLGPLGLNQGNFTGSGLPMKFAMSNGSICDIYQHLNNVYDQQYNENHDPEGFFECFKGLLDRSLNDGVYSYISIKSHNDEYYFSRDPLLKMLAYARSQGIPVWSAERLAGFLRAREQARFTDIRWSGKDLEFRLVTPPGNYGMLTVMIPFHYNGMDLMNMKINGNIVPYSAVTVSGAEYALGSADPGKNYHFYAHYK